MRHDLGTFLDDDSVELSVLSRAFPEGKVYSFASPDFATGAKLTRLADLGFAAAREPGSVTAEAAAALQLDDADEATFYRDILGSTLDEMVADGVSHTRVSRVAQYLFLYWIVSPDAANAAVAAAVGEPAPSAPNRGQRRAAKKTTSRATRTDSPAPSPRTAKKAAARGRP